MANKMEVTICVPPEHEQHIAQLSWITDEVIEPGTDGTIDTWAALTVENGFLELIIYPPNDSEPWRFPFNEVVTILQEGKLKLLDLYPEFQKT